MQNAGIVGDYLASHSIYCVHPKRRFLSTKVSALTDFLQQHLRQSDPL
ncbi:hypothetical protein LZP73_19035 [Shewanella sp. AS16]|nr:hypothetical protein [Shewanella sp. AS16]MCE9688268.1 hypothetical protein [Shewanella sp. AS16]